MILDLDEIEKELKEAKEIDATDGIGSQNAEALLQFAKDAKAALEQMVAYNSEIHPLLPRISKCNEVLTKYFGEE